MRAAAGLLVALVVLLPSSAAAAPATAELRLQAPLALDGEVSLAAAEGLLALPSGTGVPGRAARLNVTLLGERAAPDERRDAGEPAPLGDLVPALGPRLRAAPADEVRYFEMLEPEGLVVTTRQAGARGVLAVGPFDEGALLLQGSRAAVREAPARVLGPLPDAFARGADAAMVAASAAGEASARGSVRGLFQGVGLLVQNATASLQLDTTYHHDGVRWTAVLRWHGADLRVASREAFDLLAPALQLRLDGTLASAGAWGGISVQDQAQRASGQAVQATGVMQGRLAPGGGSVALRGQGDLAHLTLGGARQDFLPAAVAGGAALLGALAWRFLAVPLYARIAPSELLDNDVRRRVHAHVTANAGADVKGTAEAVGVSWSTAAYHLARLEREGVLTSRRAGRSKRFFVNGGLVTGRAEAIGALRNPTALAIAELVAAHPGMMQKELGAALRLPASTVSWHMRRLRDLGVVREDRRWRRAEYAPGPQWPELRDAVRALPPAAAPAGPPPPALGGAPTRTSA